MTQRTPLYEVGTYEQYEAGFHAFYRTLNKDRATAVLELAKDCKKQVPKYDSEQPFEPYHDACELVNAKLHSLLGRDDFNISMYSGSLYEIVLRTNYLDD